MKFLERYTVEILFQEGLNNLKSVYNALKELNI